MRPGQLSLLLLIPSCLFGQSPAFLPIVGSEGGTLALRSSCANQAGTFNLGLAAPTNKSSATSNRQHIYLCHGDSVSIVHNRDYNLNGDPNPATPAGIGYVMYKCPPVGPSGPGLVNIRTDRCLETKPSAGGGFTTPTSGLWMVRGNREGDLTFFNQGQIQDAFNSGNPSSYWFAPATLDDFDGRKYEAASGSTLAGACVNVSLDQAIRVTYLNPIKLTPVPGNCAGNTCVYRFRIEGGLPQLDGTQKYMLDIRLKGNSVVRGRLIGPGSYKSGDTLEFFVPLPGMYEIVARDDYSCDGSLTIDAGTCLSAGFQLPRENAKTGQEICIPVTVSSITRANSLTFGITWDKNILAFSKVVTSPSNLTGLDPSLINYNAAANEVRISYLQPGGTPFSLPADALLFTLCLRVVGNDGTSSPLTFQNVGTALSPLEDECAGKPMGFTYTQGQVNVTNDVLFVDVKVDSIPCTSLGQNTGGFQFSVASGTPPYRVSWKNNDDGSTGSYDIASADGKGILTGMKGGKYTLTITDNANPTNSKVLEREIPPARDFVVRLDVVKDIICNNDGNGELKARIFIDGQETTNLSPFSFSWVNLPSERSDRLINLQPGTFSLNVRDERGCTASATQTLTNPSRINISQVSLSKATCAGIADGELVVNVSGGIPFATGYRLKWADQSATLVSKNPVRSDLLAGIYSLAVTDERGCQRTQVFPIDVVRKIDFDATPVPATCKGKCDGRIVIVVSATAGTPSFSLSSGLIPSGSGINFQFDGLCSNSYSIRMLSPESGKQCALEKTVLIVDPALLKIDTVQFRQESCTAGGGKDGLIEISAKGGQAPYTYSWTGANSTVLSTRATADKLSRGNYSVKVLDAGGCEETFPFAISSRNPPRITALDQALVSCIGRSDGKLVVKASPGDSPISSYVWSNGVSGQNLSNLATGTYRVTVTGTDGCSVDSVVQVLNPDPFKLRNTRTFEPTCVGKSDGRIVIDPVGGTPPYQITWVGSSQTGLSLVNIAKGTYRFSLVDANNCPAFSQDVILPDAPAIKVTLSGIAEVSCYAGRSDGRATATAAYSDGRPGNFIFDWSSGESQGSTTSSSAAKLRSNLNTLTVTDNNLCKELITVNIPVPPALAANPAITPASCFASADGAVKVGPTGGRGAYTYLWNTGATGSSLQGMKKGTYSLTLTDGNGCPLTETINIPEPAQLLLTLDANLTRKVSCAGSSDGKLVFKLVNSTGINPLGPNPYRWSTNPGVGVASPVKDGLGAGTYSLTVTDTKGCEGSASHIFTTPNPVIALLEPVNPPLCHGETTTLRVKSVSGGNGTKLSDYVFSVNNSGISFPVNQPLKIFAGRTLVQVEDFLGCSYTETLDVSSPLPLLVEFNPGTLNVVLGDNTTLLKPQIQTSHPIRTYEWRPATGLSSSTVQNPLVQNLVNDQVFTLEVTDINGCKRSGDVSLVLDRNYAVFAPNVFSPNGDGINDEWRIYACLGVKTISNLRVFDRWGCMVTTVSAIAPNCEDGTIVWDGDPVNRRWNPGNYLYAFEVEFLDGYRRFYSGDFVLLR